MLDFIIIYTLFYNLDSGIRLQHLPPQNVPVYVISFQGLKNVFFKNC